MLDGTTTSGRTNSIVDVPGIQVGQYQQVGEGYLSGTTVVLAPDGGACGGVDVRGGGPGTRETDLLHPSNQVDRVHAVLLSGGSAFGLAAADGVMRYLFDQGVGVQVAEGAESVVPIVPGAVIFDLGRGGEFAATPDAAFGQRATAAATGETPALGVVGAGTGAQCGGLKGGVGSASAVLPDGTTVAALVVVNAAGGVYDLRTGELYGARHLLDGDLAVAPGGPAYQLSRPGGGDLAAALELMREQAAQRAAMKLMATTIGVIATDATLTKAQCAKVAGIGHDGMARAISPVHTMFDGDTLFTLATGERGPVDPMGFFALLDAAGDAVTRAIVRGVLAAESVTTPAGSWPSYRDTFPSAVDATGP